jgi:hypothetical protein
MDREAIVSRLLDVLGAAYQFQEIARKLRPISEIKDYPILFAWISGETYMPREVRQLPPRIVLLVSCWVYAQAKDQDGLPETELSRALDAIDVALKPSVMSGVQTLGIAGVQHCWIEGEVPRSPGLTDKTAKAMVPIRILFV